MFWLYDVTSSPALGARIAHAARIIDADVHHGSLDHPPTRLQTLPWEEGLIVHDFRPRLDASLRWLDRAAAACPAGATVFGLLPAPASATLDSLVRSRHRFTLSGLAIGSEVDAVVLASSFAAAIRHGADTRITSVVRETWRLDPLLGDLVEFEMATVQAHATLGRMLRDAGVDRKRFVRSAKRAGFDPPLRFFQALRLLEAASLLREPLTLDQVAHRMSFGSGHTLARHFRERGVTSRQARGQPLEALARTLGPPYE